MNKSFKAHVKRFIYQDQASNFMIIVAYNEQDEEVIITSNIIDVQTNQDYLFEGEFVQHPKYGHQFKAYSATRLLPKQRDMVINFLSGPEFSGVGIKLATSICDYFESDDIINNILDNEHLLSEIKGITLKKAHLIIDNIKKHQADNGLFNYIKDFNVDYNEIIKVFNKANLDTLSFIEILKENPYLLMSRNISFKDIDCFAPALTLENNSIYRVSGFLLDYLKNAT
ncbi:MAG: YrrC family ATP-dependent DNA helicase, partial [Bacilli bacterium]